MAKKEKPNTTSKKVKPSGNETEAYYRTIFEQSPDGILVIDTAGKITEFNEAACRHLGYSREEFAKLSISDIDADQTPKAIKETINKVLMDGRAEFEVRQRTKKGEIRNVHVITQVMHLSGRIVFNSIWKDITDHKQADEALRREMHFSEDIINSLPGVFYMFDKQGNFVRWNRKFEEVTGYIDGELGDMHGTDLFEGDDKTLISSRMQQVFEKGEADAEAYLVTKSGARIAYYFTGMRTVVDEVPYLVGLGIEITERKLSEEKIIHLNRVYVMLSKINEAIVRIRDQQELFETVCRIIVEHGLFKFVWIGLVEADTLLVKPVAFCGHEEGYLDAIGISAGEIPEGYGPTGSAIREGKHFMCHDIQNDQRMLPWRDEALKRGYLSSAAFPLREGARVIGALNIYSAESHYFDEAEIKLLDEVMEDISFAVEFLAKEKQRKHAEDALRASEAELHDNYFTQATINMILSESLQNITLEEILQKSLNMILSIPWISFDPIGSIHLVEDDPRIFVMKAQNSLPEPLIELCAQIPFGKCICGRAALTQKIEFADHANEQHELCYEGMRPHGHYAVPILFGGKTLGVINIYLNEGHIENQKEEEFLSAVADTLAGIIVRKKSENELRESSRKLNTLIDNLPGFVYRCANDPYWTMEYLSEGISGLTGYPAEDFIGNRIRSFASVIEPEDQARITKEVQKALGEKKFYTLEYRISTASGNQKWAWERGSGVFDGDKLLALEGFITDITERKMMEDRIEYLAYFDDLTGLPNRNLFIDRASQGIARAEYKKRLVAVLAIDVDRFKFINDTYGLDIGDAVLREVARRLKACVREGDTSARTGGDGFGILLIDIAESEDIILIVEKVMKNVSQTIQVAGKEIVLTISAGISVYPSDGKDASTLIKNADLALAKAKQQGRKNYQFYTEQLDMKASEFVLMEKNLFNAIKNEEFILHYQPYWDINTKKIVGMEALIRWQSPESGLVSPGKFIPVLEDTRMIIEVGEWILRTAISQVKEWQNRGLPVVPVSVNLSLIQFRQKDLTKMIESTIREAGFYPSLLALEMTESAFMEDIEFTYSVLERLKKIGVSISIDDFGTGYSSLANLKRFPLDNLKIDMSFVREIATDPDTASIITAIIAMAHTLNLKTIAEGIETEEQWKILRLLRCDMGQGYYVSKPVPAEEAEKMLI